MKNIRKTINAIWTSIISVCLLSIMTTGCSASGIIPLPNINRSAPLMTQVRFSGIKVHKVTMSTDPSKAPGRSRIDAAMAKEGVNTEEMLREGTQVILQQIPAFRGGGAWPKLALNVHFERYICEPGGFYALAVPTIALFPGYLLLGLPITGFCADMKVHFGAAAGDFARTYRYTLQKCSAVGLYWGELHPFNHIARLYHAFFKDFIADYQAFLDGRLPAAPKPASRELSKHNDDWKALRPDRKKTWALNAWQQHFIQNIRPRIKR